MESLPLFRINKHIILFKNSYPDFFIVIFSEINDTKNENAAIRKQRATTFQITSKLAI